MMPNVGKSPLIFVDILTQFSRNGEDIVKIDHCQRSVIFLARRRRSPEEKGENTFFSQIQIPENV